MTDSESRVAIERTSSTFHCLDIKPPMSYSETSRAKGELAPSSNEDPDRVDRDKASDKILVVLCCKTSESRTYFPQKEREGEE
jgi:hypothetical protein